MLSAMLTDFPVGVVTGVFGPRVITSLARFGVVGSLDRSPRLDNYSNVLVGYENLSPMYVTVQISTTSVVQRDC